MGLRFLAEDVQTMLVVVVCMLHVFSTLSLADATFDCKDINNAVVHSIPIKLPSTIVPQKKSARLCTDLHFKPPVNASYLDHRLIAFKPTTPLPGEFVDRMLLYGCEGEREDKLTHDCTDPSMTQCHVIGSWSPGSPGDCFYGQAGMPFGKKGFASLTLEIRWSNPHLLKNRVDSPGLQLYFTPQLREYDSSSLKLGNDYFEIPPHYPEIYVTSSCTSTCTRSILKDNIYVTTVIGLMNDLGIGQKVELLRGGKHVQDLLNTEPGDGVVKRKNTVRLHDPVLVRPGDVITTTCHYSSTNKTSTTFNTNRAPHEDEMCYAFLRFYPAQAATSLRPTCVSWKNVLTCDAETESGCTDKQKEKYSDENLPNTAFYKNIVGKCPIFGACTQECKAAVLETIASEPCMSNEDTWFQVKTTMVNQNQLGRHFLSAMASCELEIFKDSLGLGTQKKEPEKNSVVVQHTKRRTLNTQGIIRRKYVCGGAGKTTDFRLAEILASVIVSLTVSVSALHTY